MLDILLYLPKSVATPKVHVFMAHKKHKYVRTFIVCARVFYPLLLPMATTQPPPSSRLHSDRCDNRKPFDLDVVSVCALILTHACFKQVRGT